MSRVSRDDRTDVNFTVTPRHRAARCADPVADDDSSIRISNSQANSALLFPPPCGGPRRAKLALELKGGGSRDGSVCGYPPSPALPRKGGESRPTARPKLRTQARLRILAAQSARVL